jgi:hypothetical protein
MGEFQTDYFSLCFFVFGEAVVDWCLSRIRRNSLAPMTNGNSSSWDLSESALSLLYAPSTRNVRLIQHLMDFLDASTNALLNCLDFQQLALKLFASAVRSGLIVILWGQQPTSYNAHEQF